MLLTRLKCIGFFALVIAALPVVTACSSLLARSPAPITPRVPEAQIEVHTSTAFMPFPSVTPTQLSTLTPEPPTATIAPEFTSIPTLTSTITDRVDWTEAGRYVGENRTVCGPVAGARFAKDSRGQPTFLNVGEDYPSPKRFVVLIWGDDRPNFPFEPESYYEGKTICATGEIQEYQGSYEVEIRSPNAVEIQR